MRAAGANSHRAVLAAVLAVWIPLATPTRSLSADDFTSRVNRAIAKGRDYLLPQIEPLTAKPPGDYPMGRLAITVAAALKAGASAEDARIRKAFAKLRGLPLRKTYGVACYLFALDGLAKRQYKERLAKKSRTSVAPSGTARGPVRDEIVRCVRWLVEARASSQGYWSYPSLSKPGPQRHDFSNSQFAILGLQIGLEHGVRVPTEVFREIAHQFLRTQSESKDKRALSLTYALTLEQLLERKSSRTSTSGPHSAGKELRYSVAPGGWGYTASTRQPTASMTAAGTSSLIVARNGLGRSDAKLRRSIDLAILRALAWIDANFNQYIGGGRRNHYTLYSLEKVGDLGDLEKIGSHDWYREGAEYLIRTQEGNGSWRGGRRVYVETSLALLFLTRATRLKPFTAPRILTGPGAKDGNRDLVYLSRLNGFISARAVLALLGESRNSRLASVGAEVVENYDPAHRGELVPALVAMWRDHHDRIGRFARTTLKAITGIDASSGDDYLAWYREYESLGALRKDKAVTAAMITKLLDGTKSSALKSAYIDIANRHRLYELAPRLVDELSDRNVEYRRKVCGMLDLWCDRTTALPPGSSSAEWERIREDWEDWIHRRGTSFLAERRVSALVGRLAAETSDAAAAEIVAQIVALGQQAVPFVRRELQRPRHSFYLIEALEGLTGRAVGLRGP